MFIRAWSSRNFTEYLNINESFDSCIDENEEFMFEGGINLYSGGSVEDDESDEEELDKENKLMAVVRFVLFDEDAIMGKGMDFSYVADMHSGDTEAMAGSLLRSKIYKDAIDFIGLARHTVYISRFYVYPEFRKMGIARYLWENMERILLHCFNVRVRCFGIIPDPQEPTDEGWESAVDTAGHLKKRMINVIKSAGFTKLRNSCVYAKRSEELE